MCGGKEQMRIEFWWENLKGEGCLEDLDVRATIIKKNLKEIEWKYMLHSSGSGYGRVAGSCEHNN